MLDIEGLKQMKAAELNKIAQEMNIAGVSGCDHRKQAQPN